MASTWARRCLAEFSNSGVVTASVLADDPAVQHLGRAQGPIPTDEERVGKQAPSRERPNEGGHGHGHRRGALRDRACKRVPVSSAAVASGPISGTIQGTKRMAGRSHGPGAPQGGLALVGT
jgi:hypothetical protein